MLSVLTIASFVGSALSCASISAYEANDDRLAGSRLLSLMLRDADEAVGDESYEDGVNDGVASPADDVAPLNDEPIRSVDDPKRDSPSGDSGVMLENVEV